MFFIVWCLCACCDLCAAAGQGVQQALGDGPLGQVLGGFLQPSGYSGRLNVSVFLVFFDSDFARESRQQHAVAGQFCVMCDACLHTQAGVVLTGRAGMLRAFLQDSSGYGDASPEPSFGSAAAYAAPAVSQVTASQVW
jgi:hypothetical protein